MRRVHERDTRACEPCEACEQRGKDNRCGAVPECQRLFSLIVDENHFPQIDGTHKRTLANVFRPTGSTGSRASPATYSMVRRCTSGASL